MTTNETASETLDICVELEDEDLEEVTNSVISSATATVLEEPESDFVHRLWATFGLYIIIGVTTYFMIDK